VSFQDARKELHEASDDLEALRAEAAVAELRDDLPNIKAAWELARKRLEAAAGRYVASAPQSTP